MKIVLMITVFLMCFNLIFGEETIIFAIGEWEPYVGSKMENYGLAAEIVTAACSAAGIKAEYEFFPWRRAEQIVKSGDFFATFPYQNTQERAVDYYFSEKVVVSVTSILKHKSNAKTKDFIYSEIEDLVGYIVGAVAGSDAVIIPVREAGGNVDELQTSLQILRMLEAGRLDFYIDDRAVIFSALQENLSEEAMKDFVFLDEQFGDSAVFNIMASKIYPNSQEILKRINKGLNIIKENGEYENILRKYGMESPE